MIAAIRLRGKAERSKDVENTFYRLRLRKRYACTLLQEKKEMVGMLNKVKDFITYGEIDKETLHLLLEKRARLTGNKPLSKLEDGFVEKLYTGKAKLEDAGIKPFFSLHPPRKGLGKKGIKKGFSEGGALGYRGKEINKLIRRML